MPGEDLLTLAARWLVPRPPSSASWVIKNPDIRLLGGIYRC